MTNGPLEQFRLVGGTSLSLQLGLRVSVDIDMFTDAAYDTVDFKIINSFLREKFNYVSAPLSGVIGIGVSYLVGEDENNAVKLDLYYTDTFIQPELLVAPYRLATVEEIIAMKIDIIQRSGRKKDFWDLHELLDDYSISQMMELHQLRYPYHHDEVKIRKNLIDFTSAEDDFDPICLKGKYWELIKLDIVRAVQN